jgi:hypothetical protein
MPEDVFDEFFRAVADRNYRVLKYDLNAETELGTPVRVAMQAWRRFLSVGWQPRRPQDRPSLAELDVALVVWAEAEPGAGADRFVVVLPTGAPVPPNGTYIDRVAPAQPAPPPLEVRADWLAAERRARQHSFARARAERRRRKHSRARNR